MKTIPIEIPEEIMVALKMPRKQWESGIKKELALQLFVDHQRSAVLDSDDLRRGHRTEGCPK